MMKSIKAVMRQDRERYRVPRKVHDIIPINCIWNDGIFKVGGKFSKTFRFTDINYLVASREDKESMFLTYSELLNSLDSGATTKITIYNHSQNRQSFEQSILMPMRGDGLDEYRQEYNQMLIDKATGGSGIMQEKYITVSVAKKDIEEARTYFARIGADLSAHFAALGSKCVELTALEKLRILHEFYRPGDEGAFHFDAADMAKKGHDFRDYICPDSLEKNSDYLKLGNRYCRVLFLKDYASYIKDSMVTELTDLNRSMMLLALVFYLHYEAPPDEQNFPMVMEMIRAGEVREDDDGYCSPLDELFDRLEMRNPEHIALKYYRSYHSGSAKTLKSIQITLVSRLEKFNLESLSSITQTDEMELWSLGERKTAVFAVIPDNDSSFNFIVGMLYTQLFQQLYYQADVVHGGRLPIHVHFVMDEFANVALPDEFDKLLSTMRSREISVSIIIQNLAQLKALFEKQWESIVGNCDEFLYLGGNEQSTHEYVSKLLGKETIDTNTYGQSKGRSGSYSTNWQLAGRELMTPDEVRMLDNQYALLFIRGERPVMDLKYDILKHPNVKLTTDGGAEPYRHGEDARSIASVQFAPKLLKQAAKPGEDFKTHNFLLLTEEELESAIQRLEEKQNENQQKKQ